MDIVIGHFNGFLRKLSKYLATVVVVMMLKSIFKDGIPNMMNGCLEIVIV